MRSVRLGRLIQFKRCDRGFLLLLVMITAMLISILVAQGLANRGTAQASTEHVTTEQHRESETWWPTLDTAPLAQFGGTARCVQCHTDEGADAGSSDGTSMARAARREEADAMFPLPDEFLSGAFTYSLAKNEAGLQYRVSRGDLVAVQPIEWVMGAGDLGTTFVYKRDGRWYQSLVSTYRAPPHLDRTTGLTMPGAVEEDHDLAAALGKVLSPEEVRRCFSCHTVHATTSGGFNAVHAEAGVGCEACHGPGAAHAGSAATAPMQLAGKSIVNPAKLSPADSIDFCGACHRTFGDVTEAANPANDNSVVRFQPYRLEESRCWSSTQDARLTCVACHDPHQSLVRDDVVYDKHCLSCHKGASAAQPAGKTVAKVCPTGAASRCVSCHMPKVQAASMHGEFTDHFIRVVHKGDDFPR